MSRFEQIKSMTPKEIDEKIEFSMWSFCKIMEIKIERVKEEIQSRDPNGALFEMGVLYGFEKAIEAFNSAAFGRDA